MQSMKLIVACVDARRHRAVVVLSGGARWVAAVGVRWGVSLCGVVGRV